MKEIEELETNTDRTGVQHQKQIENTTDCTCRFIDTAIIANLGHNYYVLLTVLKFYGS